MKLKGKKIAFLGDSITEGVGASEYKNCFVEKVHILAELKEVFNYGISGTRIAPQNKPSEIPMWDQDFISRVNDMEKDVDAVVVFGGTNDFGHGDVPLGNVEDVTCNTFSGSCDVLMRILIEKYGSIPIVFITPLHRLTEDDLINEIGLARKPLSSYVEIIRKKCEKFSIPNLDLFSAGGMQPNIPLQNELYFVDGLHPNDNGHERIAKLIINFMNNIVE